MSVDSDPATKRVTVILDKTSDWHSWLFVRKDTAVDLKVWKYIDPSVKKDDLPPEPTEPQPPSLSTYKRNATSLAQLEQDDRDAYRWEYDVYKDKLAKYEKHEKSMTTISSEIGKTVAKRHLYLIRDESTPYDRLTKLKLHFAPTDTTRKRELSAKYADLKTPAKGKRIEDWLRQWVDVTNQCKDLDLPEVYEQRAQEDFLIAAKQIEPEFAAAALRCIAWRCKVRLMRRRSWKSMYRSLRTTYGRLVQSQQGSQHTQQSWVPSSHKPMVIKKRSAHVGIRVIRSHTVGT